MAIVIIMFGPSLIAWVTAQIGRIVTGTSDAVRAASMVPSSLATSVVAVPVATTSTDLAKQRAELAQLTVENTSLAASIDAASRLPR